MHFFCHCYLATHSVSVRACMCVCTVQNAMKKGICGLMWIYWLRILHSFEIIMMAFCKSNKHIISQPYVVALDHHSYHSFTHTILAAKVHTIHNGYYGYGYGCIWTVWQCTRDAGRGTQTQTHTYILLEFKRQSNYNLCHFSFPAIVFIKYLHMCWKR